MDLQIREDPLDPFIDRETFFCLQYHGKLRMRLRIARHVERTAIGRILRRDLERADALCLGYDLHLIRSDERTQDWQ